MSVTAIVDIPTFRTIQYDYFISLLLLKMKFMIQKRYTFLCYVAIIVSTQTYRGRSNHIQLSSNDNLEKALDLLLYS